MRKAQAERQRQFGHKRHGTIETHAKAAKVRQGALARLHASGAISSEQLDAAEAIAAEWARIGADVSIDTADLEPRVDISRMGTERFFESLARVRYAVAYTQWREEAARMGGALGIAPVLAMIVDDVGIVAVARHYGMHRRRAKRMLIEALDLWPTMLGEVARRVDEDELARFERRVG